MSTTGRAIDGYARLASTLWQLHPHVLKDFDEFAAAIPEQPEFGQFVTEQVSTVNNWDPGAPLDPEEKLHMQAQLVRLYDAHTWAGYGRNLFKVKRDLAAALILTDPAPRLVRLPYPSIVVQLPRGVIPMPVPPPLQGLINPAEHWVTWMPATERATSYGTELVFMVTASSNLAYAKVYDPVSHAPLDPLPEYNTPEYRHVNELLAPTYAAAFRVIANLCEWLRAHPAQKERPGRKKKRKKRENRERAWPTVWISGTDVTIAPELREAAVEYAVGKTRKPRGGWKLRMQHVVRGHWRNQACGPKQSLRKLIWIEPHLRGPDAKAAWSHVYEAKQ